MWGALHANGQRSALAPVTLHDDAIDENEYRMWCPLYHIPMMTLTNELIRPQLCQDEFVLPPDWRGESMYAYAHVVFTIIDTWFSRVTYKQRVVVHT